MESSSAWKVRELPTPAALLVLLSRSEALPVMSDIGGMYKGDVHCQNVIRIAVRVLELVDALTAGDGNRTSVLTSRHSEGEFAPAADKLFTSALSKCALATAGLIHASKLRGVQTNPSVEAEKWYHEATDLPKQHSAEAKGTSVRRHPIDSPAMREWFCSEVFAFELVIAQLISRLPIDVVLSGPELHFLERHPASSPFNIQQAVAASSPQAAWSKRTEFVHIRDVWDLCFPDRVADAVVDGGDDDATHQSGPTTVLAQQVAQKLSASEFCAAAIKFR